MADKLNILFYGKEQLALKSTGTISTFIPVVSLLTVVSITTVASQSIKQWWIGEISGKRCAKQIVDSLIVTAGAVIGGAGGVYVGSGIGVSVGSGIGALFGGPVGAIIGGNIGTAFGAFFGASKGCNKSIFLI
jgi:hypothetical protein